MTSDVAGGEAMSFSPVMNIVLESPDGESPARSENQVALRLYVKSGAAGYVSISAQSNENTLPPSYGIPLVQSAVSFILYSFAVIANLSADVPRPGKSGR